MAVSLCRFFYQIHSGNRLGIYRFRPAQGLDMVIIRLFAHRFAWLQSDQDVLKRLLRRASYATADLSAVVGPDFGQEEIAIRRIKDGMIDVKDYPYSPRFRDSRDLEIETWENEGGQMAAPAKTEEDA